MTPSTAASRKAAAAAAAASGWSVPASPTRFGVTIQTGPGLSFDSAFAAANSRYGSLEIYRDFYPGAPSPWPGSAGYGRRPVVVSFHYLPRDVLTGRHEAELANWFRTAPRGYPIYWVYSHEPEDDISRGAFTATDYRAAWSHIRGVQRSTGRMDLRATLVLMCWTASSGSGRDWRNYYPGGDVIDVMAWDCYNYGRKAKGQPLYADPAGMFAEITALSSSLGKPFGIAETGSPRISGDSSGVGRAAWLRSLASYLSAHRALFVNYFDAYNPGSVDFRLTDAPSRQAWYAAVSAR